MPVVRRVLWLVRDNLTAQPGGDTVQVLRTADELRRLGVEVTLSAALPASLRGWDLVHLFHLDRLWEHLPVCRRLRRSSVPAVLSPIWWPTDEFDRRGRTGVQGWLARSAGPARYATLRLVQRGLLAAGAGLRPGRLDWRLLSFRAAVRRLLDTVRVLLPNSAAEQRALAGRFEPLPPCVVVPNGVDAEFFSPPAPGTARQGVLCVGRIEPRKNQLNLVRALRGLDVPLTIVGRPGRFHRRYAQRCRQEAGPDVRFVDFQPPERLRELYRAAAVHACPSWYETPGLASLEAAACGCALVVSPGGSTAEYFGDMAHYCAPDAPESIRQAVCAALTAGPPPGLARHVAEHYNWAAAAKRTLEGYALALGA